MCGAQSAGFHFGAFTCEGCKVGARRTPFGKCYIGENREKWDVMLSDTSFVVSIATI